jgi:hypothetical protein
MSGERSTDVKAGPGGVMTDEVGVVTGDLTVRTGVDEHGTVLARVQYQGAEEWYTITGAPTTGDLAAVHAALVERVSEGGGS